MKKIFLILFFIPLLGFAQQSGKFRFLQVTEKATVPTGLTGTESINLNQLTDSLNIIRDTLAIKLETEVDPVYIADTANIAYLNQSNIFLKKMVIGGTVSKTSDLHVQGAGVITLRDPIIKNQMWKIDHFSNDSTLTFFTVDTNNFNNLTALKLESVNQYVGVRKYPTVPLDVNGSVKADNFISTVATGTQPYATTSTTLNSNLNADLVDGYHSSSLLNTSNTLQTITDNGATTTNSITAAQITVTGGAGGFGSIYKTAASGMFIRGIAGSSYDFQITNSAGATAMTIANGTYNTKLWGNANISSITIPNGASPATVSTQAHLYTLSGEMWVKDGGGTATQISPHASDAPEWMYDDDLMPPQIDKEMNDFSGLVRYTNNTRKNRLVEMQLNGEKLPKGNKLKFIFTETYEEHNLRTGDSLVMDNWNEYQEREYQKSLEEIAEYEKEKADFEKDGKKFDKKRPKEYKKETRKFKKK